MRKTVTLVDVARAASVSKTTVSNFFSRPERVRPELRRQVEEAARSLGYDGPDPKGRLLSSGKVNAIGVVPPGDGMSWVFSNTYMRDFMTGVAQVCEEKGAGLSLVPSGERDGAWGIGTAVLDGLILNSSSEAASIKRALRRKLPFVVMEYDPEYEINCVGIDERAAARELARHLVKLGHRRFAVVSTGRQIIAPLLHPPSSAPRPLVMGFDEDEKRLRGVGDALAEAGLSINDVPIIEACGTEEERRMFGIGGADLLFDSAPDATAIIAMNAEMAMSALVEARRRGIDVPGKVSVVTIDDPPEVAKSDPPLTSISQSVIEKGRRAARLLFEGGPLRQIELPFKLTVRGSSAPPPA